MKKVWGFLVLLASSFATSQTFSHVVIIVQENRTPDNLFSTCNIAGADAVIPPKGSVIGLVDGTDPGHTHTDFVNEAGGSYQTHDYDYVSDPLIQPYCTLGSEYGFANRMYQTNQGPSTPAHDFIFAGSSQLNAGSDLFLSELVGGGCPTNAEATFINSAGVEGDYGTDCLYINSMPTLLTGASLTWRYYTPSEGDIWTAPVQYEELCQSVGKKCSAPNWDSLVVTNPPQVLTDILDGTLATVSWVIPSAANSDHPSLNTGGGPAWVTSIVNAIGESPFYWTNTAILITWDDWGGWYDHVSPLTNDTGFCEQYCYGFRVPLLVISAYTPAMADNDTHDFGSFLHFIENNFDLASLGVADKYADALAEFFVKGPPRTYQPIELTRGFDKDDRGDPDDY